ARLSVNLNKIALLRNSRRTGVPDLLRFARIALDSGARGITVHPRPDERHIRRNDVPEIAGAMAAERPYMELNIEGYPDERLLEIAREVRPEQCTLVPDAPDAFTSEKGWELGPAEAALVRPAIVALKAIGARVILFIDPDSTVLDRVGESGADGIEIYTGSYAVEFRKGSFSESLDACARTAREAEARHLVVNAGHDLNLRNIPPLIERIPMLAEASIGHELIADTLEMGFAAAVRAYAAALKV
ncbi:MAG: pyridoxine 5'-phosphate synthase, partial [Acetobacteraceae bacterium]|nr:pyridoxine 5'-phosphate synthase [Acetobacteraceae bacterium]